MEKKILNLKNKFNTLHFSMQVFVIGMIISATFFLLMVDSFKTYQSTVSILVNVKSEVALKNKQQITATIIELPKTLSFYERILKDNSDMRDVTIGLSPDKRKNKWNEMFSIAQINKDASVFNISITTNREADSKQLANKTVRSLFNTVAFYYDIEKDIDLRIVDGPISRVKVAAWPWMLIMSVFLGFSIAKLLSLIVFPGQVLFGQKYLKQGGQLLKKSFFFDIKKTSDIPAEKELELLNRLYENDDVEKILTAKQQEESQASKIQAQFIDENFKEIKKITKQFEPDKYPNFPEMPIYHPKASAPDNLPIGEDIFHFEQVVKNEDLKSTENVSTDVQVEEKVLTEPTKEELKKRLNDLLSGKF